MTLAQRLDRLTDNRVHATEVALSIMAAYGFREGDWVTIGSRVYRVWGVRNDADTILVY